MYTNMRFYLSVAARIPEGSSAAPASPSPQATPAASPADLFAAFFSTPSASATTAVFPTPSPYPTVTVPDTWMIVPVELTADVTVYGQLKHEFDMEINSSDYEMVSVVNGAETIQIEMRRFGHGVGMSQRGAQWMAAQYGASCKDILSFYYPGMKVVTVTWAEMPLADLSPLPLAPEPTQPPLPALTAGERYAQVKLSSRNSALNLREEPNTESSVVGTLPHGMRLIVCFEENGWAKIRTSDITGFVSLDYIVYE